MGEKKRPQKRPDEELTELLWQDGQVIMHKQMNRRSADLDKLDWDPPLRCGRSYDKSNGLTQEETAPWFPYNLDDPLGIDLTSGFFCGVPSVSHINVNHLGDDAKEGDGCAKSRPTKELSSYQDYAPEQPDRFLTEESIIPMKPEAISTDAQTCHTNTSGFINSYYPSGKIKLGTRQKNRHQNKKSLSSPIDQITKDIRQSSTMMTKMSSNCGSNEFVIPHDQGQALRNNVSCSREVTDAQTTSAWMQRHDATPMITSSSSGSGSSFGKAINQICNKDNRKRKQMEFEDTEFQSEDGEDYSIEPSKQQQRLTSTRRSRSAEVHNLSERRRRDRINEKLKALQDLIPHCSKADKASVLDEAIEYLKSLQLQVQFMWMGSGMAQMMLPNLQHYLSGLGMGMAHGSAMPTIPGSIQMPTMPMFNQHISENSTNQVRNNSFPPILAVNQSSQMQQNLGLVDVYARLLGIHQTHPPTKLNLPTGDLPL